MKSKIGLSLYNHLKHITPLFLKEYYRKLRKTMRSIMRFFYKNVKCNVNGLQIIIGISSEIEQFRVQTYVTKEPETLEWLDQNLHNNDILYDVGANIGLYSLYAAKRCPKCQVFAFEPESQNFAQLCKNIVLNSLTNIIPCNFPLSDQEVFDFFYVGEFEPGSALHSFGAISDFNVTKTFALKQGSVATTLDALILKYKVPEPGLIKIDVDGIEDKILEGSKWLLESGKLRTILVELNAANENEFSRLMQIITNYGFKLAKMSNWVVEMNGLHCRNYIFQRQ